LTAGYIVPIILEPLARVIVEGREHIPATGPVILAANHRDNLDGYLLMHLVPRMVHVAGRPDAFGTGALCWFWRRLGVFPADGWGLRYALTLLSDARAIVIFPQAMISADLGKASGAVGLLALRSGAPVIPVAIAGTDTVDTTWPFVKRAAIFVHFGLPMTFSRSEQCTPRSLDVADEILRRVGALLDADVAADCVPN
jgi:1-acyl-sn-glycerol-3-phosphate acyltransferase